MMSVWGYLCLQVISAYDVYLNSTLIIQEYQVWRLITNFFYFGKLGKHLHLDVLTVLYLHNSCVIYPDRASVFRYTVLTLSSFRLV